MACGCKAMSASGDPKGRSISALSGLRRRKKATKKRATKARRTSKRTKRSKGAFCVYSPKGKLFNCFEKESSARKVVRGMSKRSKGWKLRKKTRS